MQRDSIVIKLRRAAIESDIAAFRHAVARVICITFGKIRLIARHKRAEDAFLRITAEQRILCRSVDLHGIAVDRCIRRKIFTIDDRSILRRQGEGCGVDGDLHAARLCRMVGRGDVVVDGISADTVIRFALDVRQRSDDPLRLVRRQRGDLALAEIPRYHILRRIDRRRRGTRYCFDIIRRTLIRQRIFARQVIDLDALQPRRLDGEGGVIVFAICRESIVVVRAARNGDGDRTDSRLLCIGRRRRGQFIEDALAFTVDKPCDRDRICGLIAAVSHFGIIRLDGEHDLGDGVRCRNGIAAFRKAIVCVIQHGSDGIAARIDGRGRIFAIRRAVESCAAVCELQAQTLQRIAEPVFRRQARNTRYGSCARAARVAAHKAAPLHIRQPSLPDGKGSAVGDLFVVADRNENGNDITARVRRLCAQTIFVTDTIFIVSDHGLCRLIGRKCIIRRVFCRVAVRPIFYIEIDITIDSTGNAVKQFSCFVIYPRQRVSQFRLRPLAVNLEVFCIPNKVGTILQRQCQPIAAAKNRIVPFIIDDIPRCTAISLIRNGRMPWGIFYKYVFTCEGRNIHHKRRNGNTCDRLFACGEVAGNAHGGRIQRDLYAVTAHWQLIHAITDNVGSDVIAAFVEILHDERFGRAFRLVLQRFAAVPILPRRIAHGDGHFQHVRAVGVAVRPGERIAVCKRCRDRRRRLRYGERKIFIRRERVVIALVIEVQHITARGRGG